MHPVQHKDMPGAVCKVLQSLHSDKTRVVSQLSISGLKIYKDSFVNLAQRCDHLRDYVNIHSCILLYTYKLYGGLNSQLLVTVD